jgi:hypothetical protein
MAEPASSGAAVGAASAAAAVALVAPALGEYAVILFAALAGALWPLSGRDGITRTDGALLVLRLVCTSVALTGALAWWVHRQWPDLPTTVILAPLSFGVAALGDRWRELIAALWDRVRAVVMGSHPPPPPPPGGQP